MLHAALAGSQFLADSVELLQVKRLRWLVHLSFEFGTIIVHVEASFAKLAVATGVISAPCAFELVVDGLVMRVNAFVPVLAIIVVEVVITRFLLLYETLYHPLI